MSKKVSLVTCKVMPEPDPDQPLMLELLREAGIEVTLDAWDDESVDWTKFDLCILRSPWNYHERSGVFYEWCYHTAQATNLQNTFDVVSWNIHKSYLFKLEQADIPIVPTEIIPIAERRRSLKSVMDHRGWSDVVVKPCISAASANTRRFTIDEVEEGDVFLRQLASQRDMMVQLFMPSVDTPGSGERAAMMIGGEITHAIEKKPRFADDDESVSDELPVTDEERDLFERALAVVPGEVLYARLDTMADAEGTRLISELEVIEP